MYIFICIEEKKRLRGTVTSQLGGRGESIKERCTERKRERNQVIDKSGYVQTSTQWQGKAHNKSHIQIRITKKLCAWKHGLRHKDE